jgi:hypothetical protein
MTYKTLMYIDAGGSTYINVVMNIVTPFLSKQVAMAGQNKEQQDTGAAWRNLVVDPNNAAYTYSGKHQWRCLFCRVVIL